MQRRRSSCCAGSSDAARRPNRAERRGRGRVRRIGANRLSALRKGEAWRRW